MDSIKQNIASEENDIFASKKQVGYKALEIKINETLFPSKPTNISYPIEIDSEYNYVDGFRLLEIAIASNELQFSTISIRTDYETILSDIRIHDFSNNQLDFLNIEELLFPCLVKGSGKKIYVDIKNIIYSESSDSLKMKVVFRQKTSVAFPKFNYDIIKKQFTQTLDNNYEIFDFNINSKFNQIIGFVNPDSQGVFSLYTDNIIIFNKMPFAFFSSLRSYFNFNIFKPVIINNINNINFTLESKRTTGQFFVYFLVRKPFVQPY